MPAFRNVEVVDSEGGENPCYYEATIQDVRDDKLYIVFENNWREPCWMDAKLVRAAPPETNSKLFDPKDQDLVEVQAPQAPNEPPGWWRAKILAKSDSGSGTLYMVHFTGWDNYDDVVGPDEIRPRNVSPDFSEIELTKVEIKIPGELDSSKLAQSLFRDMQSPTSIYSIYVKEIPNPEAKDGTTKNERMLVCIGSGPTVKTALPLAKMLFKHQRELLRLRRTNMQVEQEFQLQRKRLSNCKRLKIRILDGMMGLVIGKSGKRIEKAKKIKGVESIQVLDQEKQIIIVAETMAAANKAREILEIVKSTFAVPEHLFGRFVGREWTYIQDIEKESGVIYVRAAKEKRIIDTSSGDKKHQDDGDAWGDGGSNPEVEDWAEHTPAPTIKRVVDLEIVGTPSSIVTARILLQARMTQIEEINTEINYRRKINVQLDELNTEFGIGRKGRRGGRGRGGRRGERGRGEGRRGRGRKGTRKDTKETEGKEVDTETAGRGSRKGKKKNRRKNRKTSSNANGEGKHNDADGKQKEATKTEVDSTKIEGNPQRKKRDRRNRGKVKICAFLPVPF